MKTNPTALMRRAGAGVSVGALVTASLLLTTAPAHALTLKTITSLNVNTDETRATGHNEFGADGVHVYTEGATSTDKAAGYFAIDQALATAGEPSMNWTAGPNQPAGHSVKPSVQLVVDFDGDGSADGTLVGEPTYADGTNLYGDTWWLSNGSKQAIKDAAPSHAGGFGSDNNGTLAQWRSAFPNADIVQTGWSLGSGVKGDGTITQIKVGGTAYRFAASPAPSTTELLKSDVNFSETRATGHNVFLKDGGVHVYTESNGSTDKAAGYFDVNQPLAGSGEPALDKSNVTGTAPGAQLVVDFDGDGTADANLVGEPDFYGNDWWVSNSAKGFVKDNAPSHTGGSGSANHGTLNQWRDVFPDAQILQGGWSLGSGVKGDAVVNSQTIGTTKYTFADQAPTANDVSGLVRDDGTTTISTDASDPDGDALTYSVDGAQGEASVNSNGVISYDPNGTTGSDSFTYTATDEGGATATANVDVTIDANGVPVANDVTGNVRDDGTTTIPTDASDPDGDTLSYIIGAGEEDGSIGQPTKGTATVGTDGIISYTPNDDVTGPDTDTFQYTVTDGHGGNASGNVTVTIGANTPPVAPTVKGSVQAGASVTVTLAGSDSDDDTLTYELNDDAVNGTATLVGDDQVKFDADANFHGGTTFTYTATDGHGGSTTGTVKINVGRATSHVSFTTSPDPLKSSSTVVVDVHVASTGLVHPGVVNIYDGTKLVGTGKAHTSGDISITLTSKLSKGTHTLRAKYLGTTFTNAKSHSQSVTVK